MKKLFRKIKNKSGETIGETLVALLISALALVMLAGAIATASGIITKSSDKIDEYYDKNNQLVTMTEGPVPLTIKGGALDARFNKTVDVKYGKNDVFHVVGFQLDQ